MSNAVVVKQGQPSAPGTVVDTGKAKVVPPSSEVKTEAAAREVAGQRKETQAKIDGLAKKMTGSAKKPAAKAAGKGSAKANPAAKPRRAGNGSGPSDRLTTEWLSAKRRDVKVKDRIKTAEGVVIDVIGRWTKKTAQGNVPMVTGHIVSIPTDVALDRVPVKGNRDGKKKGDRHNAVAAEVTHTK